jgi:NAD-dependent dihydropyrimidine dehydrogenase PreA subunit
MMIFIEENKCTLCGDCVEACPWQALSLAEGKLVIDRDLCAECGACLRLCPVGAIYEVEPAPAVAVDVNAEPVLRADTTAVALPAKLERIPILTSPRVAPPPLWVGVLPLAARFVGGLADWWLDRRRPSTWDGRSSPVARRGLGGGTPPATPLTGSPGIRRRWRGGRGR